VDFETSQLRFDIELLAERLVEATTWLTSDADTRKLPIGYFGASTGAGAALMAAAERPARIGAVVSRGGRPDLAGAALPKVQAPTLLIVGSKYAPVITLNRQAFAALRCEKQLRIVTASVSPVRRTGETRGNSASG
jgi:putative phosphoribosyl transferase